MKRKWAISLALALAFLASARAVVIDTVTGTGNTNAPADDPGWANIGILGAGTGIYLGAGWVLSAAHVGAGSITLAGTSYAAVPGTTVQLTNSVPGKTTYTDLILFQLASTPVGLGSLTLSSSTPSVGESVTMIGAGRDRGAFTEWTVNTSTDPWTWTQVESGGNAAGYQALSTRAMRWGTNSITSKDFWVNDGIGDIYSFDTTFTAFGSPSDEAQAAYGDSGGAVFRKNGSSWELNGLMFSVGGYSGQPDPGANSIYGNVTYSADISAYGAQIMSIIPEPSVSALLALALLAGGCAARKKLLAR